MREQLSGLSTEVYGGIALNQWVGGINPYAVELCLRMGGRCVWFPTVSSSAHIDHHNSGGGFPSPTIPLTSRQTDLRGADGDLAGLHGVLVFEGIPGVGGTYSGLLHFDP